MYLCIYLMAEYNEKIGLWD